MRNAFIQAVENKQLKTDVPPIKVGDTVDIHVRIVEGAKERVQVFNGVVIGIAGSGLTQMVTVRRIVMNEGVERVFPMHSPKIAKIVVRRHAHARRAKLYYIREVVGKKRRLRDARRGLENLVPEGTEGATNAVPAGATAAGGEGAAAPKPAKKDKKSKAAAGAKA